MNESVQVDGLDYRVTTNYWEINIHRWNIEVETWKRFCIISSNLSSLDTSLRYQKRAVKTWDVLCFPLRTQELTQYAPIKSPLNSLNIHIFFSIMKSRYLTAIQDFSLLRPLILLHRTRKESKILILNLRYGQSTCQNGMGTRLRFRNPAENWRASRLLGTCAADGPPDNLANPSGRLIVHQRSGQTRFDATHSGTAWRSHVPIKLHAGGCHRGNFDTPTYLPVRCL